MLKKIACQPLWVFQLGVAVLLWPGLNLNAATDTVAKQQHSQRLVFVSLPEVELDPNLSTPLAALLSFRTLNPARVVVKVSKSNEEKNWTVDFNQYNTQHALPILGLHPDSSYTLQVRIFNKSGQGRSFHKTLSLSTDPLPEGFPGIELKTHIPEKVEPGFTLLDIIPEGENAEFGSVIAILDNLGKVIWYQIGSRYTDVQQLPNGNLLFITSNKIVEMDLLGNTVSEIKANVNLRKPAPGVVKTRNFHHEIFPLGKNYLSLSVESRQIKNYPAKIEAKSKKEKANVVGDLVIEFQADGTLLKQWSLLDMLDPYRLGYDSLSTYWDTLFVKKTRDWSHGNAVIHNPVSDSIIVSLRHQDATINFSRKTGKLRWILGTHANWDKKRFGQYLLQPVNHRKNFFPYHAHAPAILPNGNLLIYDNGNWRASPFKQWVPHNKNFSRVVEYEINEKTRQVKLVWEHGEFVENRLYSGALGDADKLPKTGNILITHGNLYDKKQKLYARIIEVTHTTPATEVFAVEIFDTSEEEKNGWRSYRARRIPSLYPHIPSLQAAGL
ncbi:MAG: aryl-sulfate sulfotransferase [Gammaproteobacteria bacterium]|nr:aryl-sulfate sulfotransferase [Gammaproteobacteria bacterium]MDH5799496.1 aryl-sulfate sulfotransferase [Gammaproteobacteria bacterium]